MDLRAEPLKITAGIVAGAPREAGAAQSVSASSQRRYIPRSEDGKLQFDSAVTVTGTRKGAAFEVYDANGDHKPVGKLSIVKLDGGEVVTDAIATLGGKPPRRTSHGGSRRAGGSSNVGGSSAASTSASVYGTRQSISHYGNRNHETLAAYTLGRLAVGRPVGDQEFEMLLHAVENTASVRYLYMQHGFGDVAQDRANSNNESLTRTIAVQQVLQGHAELSDPERAALIRFAGAGNCKQQAELTMATYGPNVGPDDSLHLVSNPRASHAYVIHQGGGARAGINVMVDAWSPIGALNVSDATVVDIDLNQMRTVPLSTPLSNSGTFVHQTYNRATATRMSQEFHDAWSQPSANLAAAMNEFNQVHPGIYQQYAQSDFVAGTQPNANVLPSFADAVRQSVDATDINTCNSIALAELQKISPNASLANAQSTLARARNLMTDETEG